MKRTQKEGANLQYKNNHSEKFDYKGMKTVGVTDYTNLEPLKCCGQTDGQTDGGMDGRTEWTHYKTCLAKVTQVKRMPKTSTQRLLHQIIELYYHVTI